MNTRFVCPNAVGTQQLTKAERELRSRRNNWGLAGAAPYLLGSSPTVIDRRYKAKAF